MPAVPKISYVTDYPDLRPSYSIEDIKTLLEWATGTPKDTMDVYNKFRTGKTYRKARVRRGHYDRKIIDQLIQRELRRRLAADLGRTRNHWLPAKFYFECPQCPAPAVTWGLKWKCGAGHEGINLAGPAGKADE